MHAFVPSPAHSLVRLGAPLLGVFGVADLLRLRAVVSSFVLPQDEQVYSSEPTGSLSYLSEWRELQ